MTNNVDPMVTVGQQAPDFSLVNTHGTPVDLLSLRGSAALLVFYPFAFSRICSGELCELRDNFAEFSGAGVRVLAISCDPVFSLKAWSEQENFGFDLLSDFWPHGEVARAYGVFDEASGMAIRGSFLLDATGRVQWSVLNQRGERREFADYRRAVQKLLS